MVVVFLLALGWFSSPLGALVLDFNHIKSSADIQGTQKGSQCLSDKDCNTRKFCLKLHDEKPFCVTRRGLWRRCQRNAMCCPGTLCVNDVCTAMEDAAPISERETDDHDDKDIKTNLRGSQILRNHKAVGVKKETAVLELLTVELDFAVLIIFGPKFVNFNSGVKIDKVLLEGQVCSRRGHKDTAQAPEIFQRGDCGPGLLCRSQVTGN